MNSRLFGYNKKEVELYIDRIARVYEGNIEKQINDINLIKKEKDQLRLEIDQMSSKLNSLTSYEVLKLSLDRLETVYRYLKDYEQDDSSVLSSKEYLIKEKLKENILKIENEIQEIKESIKRELDQINKIIKSTNLSLVTTKDSTKHDESEASIRFLNARITADGTFPLDELDNLEEDIKPKKNKSPEKVTSIFELNSFWGKIENPKEEEEPHDQIITENEKINQLGLNQASVTQEEHEEQEEKNVSGSHGLKAQIDIARYKFILGKIAGEDLFDATGCIIVNKHEEITPEVVEAAQKENKLSELIINMLVQGMDE